MGDDKKKESEGLNTYAVFASDYEKLVKLSKDMNGLAKYFRELIPSLDEKGFTTLLKAVSTLFNLNQLNLILSLAIVKEMKEEVKGIRKVQEEQGKHIDLIESIIEYMSTNEESLRKDIESLKKDLDSGTKPR